jgi:eukaryotic-like serine/threonine-protein kinase
VSDPDDNGRKPPAEDQRTVFVPSRLSGGSAPDDPKTPAAADVRPSGNDSDAGEAEASGATQWEPLDEQPDQSTPAAPPPAPPTAEVTAAQSAAIQTTIKIGDCLNHIYEVKRFIARGGMGEVFEGVNVTSDERVAIKVMLPSLAADPNVIAMFRREARSMTRLQHEALVQYRVLAQEPQRRILYIVTDFIDGTPLCDVLETLKPSPEQLEMLLRRLASGLRAAHQLGILHRDISPDNVLLEGGQMERAKIVDFGIAKDLNPGSATIIGDGFAGKLGYVAPEQLGDFDRELGPWTDVYSLALVMAAAAVGHDLKMGGTLVDAVDKRRAGPDLSGVSENMRPVLAAMLRANPAERLRSMDDVIAMLDARRAPPPSTGSTGHAAPKLPRGTAIAGGAAAVVLLGGLTLWLTSGSEKTSGPGTQSESGQGPTAHGSQSLAQRDPVRAAEAAINSIIPSIPCSWLNMSVKGDSQDLNVILGGVAGDPSDAQAEVASALTRANLPNANIEASGIAPIEPGGCSALDAFRQIPKTDAQRLITPQLVWHRNTIADTGDYKGQHVAKTIVRFSTGDLRSDMTLVGIEPSGVITPIFASRAELEKDVANSLAAFRAGEWKETNPTKTAPDQYEFKVDINHDGWSGLALMTGNGPFSTDLVAPPLGTRNGAWRDRFATVAAQQGWKADMLWFKVED